MPRREHFPGAKTWDDDGNKNGKRPENITVHLLKVNSADPSKTKEVDVRTVNASNDWKWSFDVNLKESGQPVTYKVLEDDVPYC